MTPRVSTHPILPLMAALLFASAAHAAPGDQPVKPLLPSATAQPTEIEARTTSLPAQGLFDGDRLTLKAQQALTELIIDAQGLNVEVALLVPTGPWKIDGKASDERSLTTQRLNALRSFLTDRGVDPKRIYVESRIDEKITEPRLDVQLLGKPAQD